MPSDTTGNIVIFRTRSGYSPALKPEAGPKDEVLMLEAKAIEAWHGPNPYSNYMAKNKRRPSPAEADTIGFLLGGRVLADDGSMRPLPTSVDRKVSKAIRSRRNAAARRYDHILRLTAAVEALAHNEDDPRELIAASTNSCLLNDPTISGKLSRALSWLQRFAEEWHCHEEKARAESALST